MKQIIYCNIRFYQNFGFIFASVFAAIFLSACKYSHYSESQYYALHERDDHKIRNAIYEASENNQPLIFNSYGGNVKIGLEISKLLADLELVVNLECSSNCAEILLPASKNVRFDNQPIIGFHGNIFSYAHYVADHAKYDKHNCNWQYAAQKTQLLKKKRMNTFFWKEQMKRLKPNVTFEYEKGKCPLRQYNFENQIWLPTSEQLRTLWGLKFEGEVCADNIKKCSKRADDRWPKNTRIVIGDEIYIAKGW